jgi:hypothetical protein
MNKFFFYLYLVGGSIAAALLGYDLVTTWPNVAANSLVLDILPMLLLYYLAYKTYHEKKDKELM